MKILNKALYSISLFAVPFVTFAQLNKGAAGDGGQLEDLVQNIVQFLNDIIVPGILAIGFVFFVWGMFQFFIAGGSNDESKEKGKSLMIYATLGFVLIIIFWGVINLLANSIGLGGKTLDDRPELPDIFDPGY